MNKYPFYAALSHCSELYGVDLDEDLFETYGMSAWRKIGNKDYKLYRARIPVQRDCDGQFYIDYPCNADAIEAITLDHEDFQDINVVSDNLGMATAPIEQQIEWSKHNKSPLYLSGKLIKYYELGDKIYFSEPYSHVNILYKGIYADEDGLPYLTEKEIEAIAAYCAYADDYKKARVNKDGNLMQMAANQMNIWKQLCAAARIPESISQNSMNDILDAATSWNRKAYGRDFKPTY